MAEGLNRVILLGNLGADPELRMTGGGTGVLKIRLATTESYLDKDKQRKERTEWHSIVVWGRRAEALGKILSKGDRILVEGGLRTSSYDDKDGNKRYKTEIVASNVVLGGGGNRGGSGGGGGGRSSSGSDDGGGDWGDEPMGGAGGGDDDIPF